jgi:hypothetical protein
MLFPAWLGGVFAQALARVIIALVDALSASAEHTDEASDTPSTKEPDSE